MITLIITVNCNKGRRIRKGENGFKEIKGNLPKSKDLDTKIEPKMYEIDLNFARMSIYLMHLDLIFSFKD